MELSERMCSRNLNPVIKIFVDTAEISEMRRFAADGSVAGFTTNPTLMRLAKVTHAMSFYSEVAGEFPDHPVSFEVFADDLREMTHQAEKIGALGQQVFVKIPVSTTTGDPTFDIVRELALSGVRVNVTAVMTTRQVIDAATALSEGTPSILSYFAGRVADSGRDPVPYFRTAKQICAALSPDTQVLWASAREWLNVTEAAAAGADIITLSPAILDKRSQQGRCLNECSLDVVRMFHRDAVESGYNVL